MSDTTRRDLLRNVALAASLGGFSADAAQRVHQLAFAEKSATGGYAPKLFLPHEWETLDVLAEFIVPGARKGGAKEFIDLLASENKDLSLIFTGGLAWLDDAARDRYGATFIQAKPARQTELLDLISNRENDSSQLRPGIRFFTWARKLVVDAYYTSKAGIAELGFMGNQGLAEFTVPQAAIDYALKRSGGS